MTGALTEKPLTTAVDDEAVGTSDSSKQLHRLELGDVVHAVEPPPKWKAWAAWVIASLAYSFAFFSRVAPSGIFGEIETEFGVSDTVLGMLGAEYFYLYIVLQIPVGALIAKFGVRKTLVVLMTFALIGTLMFALAQQLWLLHAGRVLIGVGCSSAFLSFVTVVKEWFPPASSAILMGFSMTLGVTGAVMGQGPLSAMASAFGWRAALVMFCAVPVGVIAAAWFLMDDFGPRSAALAPDSSDEEDSSSNKSPSMSLKEQWFFVKRTRQVWVAAAVGCCLNATLMSFQGMWATPFYEDQYGVSEATAGLISSAGFLGNAIGGPILGAVADRFKIHKPLVIASLVWQVLAMLTIVFASPPVWLAPFLSFLIGAGVTINLLLAMIRAYLRSMHLEHITAFAGGFMNTFFLGSPIVLQPLVGAILDAKSGHTLPRPDAAYHAALAIFPCCALVGVVVATFVRTKGKRGAEGIGSVSRFIAERDHRPYVRSQSRKVVPSVFGTGNSANDVEGLELGVMPTHVVATPPVDGSAAHD